MLADELRPSEGCVCRGVETSVLHLRSGSCTAHRQSSSRGERHALTSFAADVAGVFLHSLMLGSFICAAPMLQAARDARASSATPAYHPASQCQEQKRRQAAAPGEQDEMGLSRA